MNKLINYFNKNIYFFIEKWRVFDNMRDGKKDLLVKFIAKDITTRHKYNMKDAEGDAEGKELKEYLVNILSEISEKYNNVYYLINDKRDNTFHECKIYKCVDDEGKNLYYLAKGKYEKFISCFYYDRMELLYNLYCNNKKHNFKNIDKYDIYELVKVGIK